MRNSGPDIEIGTLSMDKALVEENMQAANMFAWFPF